MDDNKFNKFYSTKSVSELIVQLRSHRITGSTLDEKWYEALKTHLAERELSGEARKMVDHILSSDPDTLKSETKSEQVLNEKEKLNNPLSNIAGKYPALRTIAGFYNVLAWIIGIIAVAIAFYFGSNDGGLVFAAITVVIGALIVIGVLAVSELIKVFVDIEYNTRQSANK